MQAAREKPQATLREDESLGQHSRATAARWFPSGLCPWSMKPKGEFAGVDQAELPGVQRLPGGRDQVLSRDGVRDVPPAALSRQRAGGRRRRGSGWRRRRRGQRRGRFEPLTIQGRADYPCAGALLHPGNSRDMIRITPAGKMVKPPPAGLSGWSESLGCETDGRPSPRPTPVGLSDR